ncbi:MAG: L,D-transpeptidase family protein [Steroidobacteraceae bacterium]
MATNMSRNPLFLLLLALPLLLVPGFARSELQLSSYTPSRAVEPFPVATRVVVYKSARRMELLRGSEVLRSYKISLGLQPSGHKERVGDFRTPEGSYRLTRRNTRSEYFLSILVSYPGPDDIRRAKAKGDDPGGAIMIHGLPNRLRHTPEYYASRDWTDGCIAVTNSDMVEIWLMTQNDTPIEIRP